MFYPDKGKEMSRSSPRSRRKGKPKDSSSDKHQMSPPTNKDIDSMRIMSSKPLPPLPPSFKSTKVSDGFVYKPSLPMSREYQIILYERERLKAAEEKLKAERSGLNPSFIMQPGRAVQSQSDGKSVPDGFVYKPSLPISREYQIIAYERERQKAAKGKLKAEGSDLPKVKRPREQHDYRYASSPSLPSSFKKDRIHHQSSVIRPGVVVSDHMLHRHTGGIVNHSPQVKQEHRPSRPPSKPVHHHHSSSSGRSSSSKAGGSSQPDKKRLHQRKEGAIIGGAPIKKEPEQIQQWLPPGSLPPTSFVHVPIAAGVMAQPTILNLPPGLSVSSPSHLPTSFSAQHNLRLLQPNSTLAPPPSSKPKDSIHSQARQTPSPDPKKPHKLQPHGFSGHPHVTTPTPTKPEYGSSRHDQLPGEGKSQSEGAHLRMPHASSRHKQDEEGGGSSSSSSHSIPPHSYPPQPSPPYSTKRNEIAATPIQTAGRAPTTSEEFMKLNLLRLEALKNSGGAGLTFQSFQDFLTWQAAVARAGQLSAMGVPESNEAAFQMQLLAQQQMAAAAAAMVQQQQQQQQPFMQPFPLDTPTSVITIPPPSSIKKANEITNHSKRMFSEDSSNNDNVRDKAFANTTFEEIDQRYLQKAMEDGLVESSVTKTVIQGEARVGKSSVKSLLVSEPYTDNTSTNVIEPPCVAIRCYGYTGKYWEQINEEEMGIKVIAAVQSDAMKKLECHDEMDLSQESKKNEPAAPVTIEFSNEKDAVVRVREFYQKCKRSQKEGTSLHGCRWLYFIDSGGQIQFQKLLPAFMPYASVLLLVVNLSKDLTELSSTAMQLSEREINVSQCSLSVIEILKQLLSAIASNTQRYRSLIANDPVLSKCITPPSDKLKVLPVATHHDKYEEAIKNGKESIDDKREIINKILHRHKTCDIVGHEGRIYLYEVDGRKAQDKAFEDLQPDSDLYKIAQALEDNAYEIKVPLKWYCFGVLLHDVAKEGCGVLSLSYCQELGQQLKVNLSPEESLSAIKFLSFLNKLLFYPDSPARDLIFVNIESLINILRDLLVFVYDAHSDAKYLLPDQKALVCKGHLSIEILEKVSKSCNKISKEFSNFDKKLLGLFEYLLIAAQLDLPEKDTFFMPALLPMMDVSNINPYPNRTPLLLYFENAIPMGLFCAVIVHLLSHKESPWKVVGESNFSNYFTLQCPDLLESNIILVEQLDCITVYCKVANDYIPARDAVEEAVGVAMSKHKLSECEKPKRAFYCSCDGGKWRHAAIVSWLKTQFYYVFHCNISHESQEMATDCLTWLDQRRKQQHDVLLHLPDIDASIEYQVIVDSTTEIKEYFSDDYSDFADKLLEMNVITEREKSMITDRYTGQDKYHRMGEVIEHVKKAVQIKGSVFSQFLNIFLRKVLNLLQSLL